MTRVSRFAFYPDTELLYVDKLNGATPAGFISIMMWWVEAQSWRPGTRGL